MMKQTNRYHRPVDSSKSPQGGASEYQIEDNCLVEARSQILPAIKDDNSIHPPENQPPSEDLLLQASQQSRHVLTPVTRALLSQVCQQQTESRLKHQQVGPSGTVPRLLLMKNYHSKKTYAINQGNPICFSWCLTIMLALFATTLVDWRPAEPDSMMSSRNVGIYDSIMNIIGSRFSGVTKRGVIFAEAQYRPDWPSKSVQQEIFLLNLEDGYFGCQVNESQDFLQLFELSRLCDGQTQCYLGTDEMVSPLKCNSRERCGTYVNSRGHQEIIQCVNGVCLDGLCYCNDGFGGKACDIPDENECKYRPCDVFAHCTNTMGSYYCSCFPGKFQR